MGPNSLTEQSKTVIDNNNYSSQQKVIENLRMEYDKTLKEYEDLMKKISGDVSGYVDMVNPNNPYLNKTIQFTTGQICYVTNQGVAKYISSAEILNSLDVPKKNMNINIPWKDDYLTPGSKIPTTPSLISGTPMKMGQSVGNEGSNVFVSDFLPDDIKSTYMGCYASSPKNDNMTFIGGSPPVTDISIQNGSFSQPAMSNNTYKYITGSEVPNWYFTSGAVLINNSSAWGYKQPYPNGNQCVSLQNKGSISQIVSLYTGVTYTLSFYSCARACCTTPTSNNIEVRLYTINDGYISTIYQVTPPVNKWTLYTVTFTAPTTQSYKLTFLGTNTAGDRSSAIQNISLGSSAPVSQGTYTHDDCQKMAIINGYQYFALQNVNPNTSTGYCAVSNSEPAITMNGESKVPTKFVNAWETKTIGQPGNSAILTNTGSLSVVNSSGQSVFSSSGAAAQPSNYLGCYGDTADRAMPLYNNSSQQYNLQQCQQIAQQQGAQYFGLQNSTSGTTATCGLSNNLGQTLKYGRASNCTKLADGSYSGGGWSNAVYNTTLPQSNYILILGDYYMQIQRGTSPDDDQGYIWGVNFNDKKGEINANYVAKNGKYGKNWISSGQTLAAGDWIGSPNGYAALVMQSDGNLVLNTYQMESNCKKMKDNNIGGGVGGNATYNIGKTAITKNMGSLAYIDANSDLHSYPTTNQTFSNEYTTISNMDSPNNDIPGAATSGNPEQCKTICNKNPNCAGFVTDKDGKYCWPKSTSMWPYGGQLISSLEKKVYTRNKIPASPPIGVSKITNQTDTISYQNYVNGGAIADKYGLANINDVQKKQLEQLETKMNLLSSQLTTLTNKFQSGTTNSENQSINNVSGINDYLTYLTQTNKDIVNITTDTSGNVNNILKDSDIVVLQKNYDYLVWSILAVGTVLVSMNLMNK